MKLSTGKILLITLLLTAITVAVALYISVNQSQKVNETFLSLSHTQSVLYHSEKLLAAVAENETVAREFVLTGDEEYLSSLQKNKAVVFEEFNKLKALVADNANQHKKLDTLYNYIKTGTSLSDSIVMLRTTKGEDTATQLLATERARNVVDTTKMIIENVEREEQFLLKERRSANTDAIFKFRTVLYVVFTLLVILMMVLIQKLRVEVIADKETFRIMQYNASLMDNIQDAVISTDKDFGIVRWNKKAEDIFGWKEEEMKGKTIAAAMNPVYRDETNATIVKKLFKNGAWEGEVSLEKKDKQSVTVLLSVSTIRKQNGRMTGSVLIARDITSRKQLEEELKKFNVELGRQVEDRRAEIKHVVERVVASEKKYKLLFESNPLSMLMMLLPDLNITDVNEAAVQQYGYDKASFLLKNINDLKSADDASEAFTQLMKRETPGYHNAGIWQHVKQNGELIYVEIFVYGMVLDGKKMKMVLSHDITEKVEADKKLKQYLDEIRMLTGHLQEIREEDRKGIAREIHDELGQQLTVLKMEVAWILKKLEGSETRFEHKLTELLETIDGIMKSVRRICAELRPASLDDLGLVAAIEWHAKQFEAKSGIAVSLDLPAELTQLSAEVKIGLYRIFQESLTNVARHANAKKVKVRLAVNEGIIVLHITDDGKGFDVPESGERQTLGILGMKERSFTLGGTYIINSMPGKGTTVMVSIPLEKDLMILNKKMG
ncbi:MAG: PAS domain S-box protein [Agriterribacter sp.]